jgi:hypothetical protein
MNFSISRQVAALVLSCAIAGSACADAAETASAASLQARYAAFQARLGSNQFQRPLVLDSSETPGAVAGDIHAVVNFPFETATAAVGTPADWCDILMLHLNTKSCRVSGAGPGTVLTVWTGTKYDQPIEEASRVDLAFRVSARSAGYLRVELHADTGPMGTRDYRITLEAIPLESGQTFIHLAFSNAYGSLGRLAMQAYFATAARDRIGFTVLDTLPDGRPRHIGGLRGAVERNVMRYYLAIESYLGALSGSPQARFEKRIRAWYEASELYARQLHEMEQGAYLDMKRKENARRPAAPA